MVGLDVDSGTFKTNRGHPTGCLRLPNESDHIAQRKRGRRSVYPNRRAFVLREDAFDRLTPEVEYWLGFLMADGCVYYDGTTPKLAVVLQKRDRGHLLALSRFLGGGKVWDQPSRNAVGYQVRSWPLTSALGKWGIVPNKTTRAVAHPDLAESRHFWRGVIDGDGGTALVENGKRLLFYCSGARALMMQLRRFIESRTGRRLRPRKDRRVRSWSINTGGATVPLTVARLFYADEDFCLERKVTPVRLFETARTVAG